LAPAHEKKGGECRRAKEKEGKGEEGTRLRCKRTGKEGQRREQVERKE